MLEPSVVPEPKEASACCHYWLIEPPGSRTSRGRCKQCGAEREFRNYTDEPPWQVAGSTTKVTLMEVWKHRRDRVDSVMTDESEEA